MRGAVCYLERSGGGTVLHLVRLVAPGVDRTWTAPDPGAGGSDSGRDGLGGSLLTGTRAAARWVAEQLADLGNGGGGPKRLGALCVDIEGGLCSWLSLPSADPAVVAAAFSQANAGSLSADGVSSVQEGSVLAAAAVLAGSAGGLGEDRSIQALGEPEAPAATIEAGVTQRLGRKQTAAQGRQRRRLAVLSVPDASVRVFLDELDREGVEVGAVLSLWHALGAAWDPGRPKPNEPGTNGTASGPRGRAGPSAAAGVEARVVASTSPTSALVLIDPRGRLTWAWSREGELVAAGAMRLRMRTVRAAAPVSAAEDRAEPATTARRIGEAAHEGASHSTRTGGPGGAGSGEDSTVIECGPAEVGRLVVEWLAWSPQLGLVPERIVCLGPQTVLPAVSAPSGSARGEGGAAASSIEAWAGAASLGEALGQAWPGTTVDAVVHDDPIGATLARLAEVGGPVTGRMVVTAGTAAPVEVWSDPRASLVELSRRPGKANRRLYQWTAAALAAAALGVGVIGWQVSGAATKAGQMAKDARAERRKALEGLEPLAPGLSRDRNPMGLLGQKLQQMREQRQKIRREAPVLAETRRVLEAMAPWAEQMRLIEVSVSSKFACVVRLTVPATGTDSTAALMEALRGTQASSKLEWDGRLGGKSGDRREFSMVAQFPPENPAGAGAGGNP